MTDKARQYKPSTIRRLDTLSGNECAAPDCNKALIAKDGKTIISKICHIEAASPEGARYNAAMNDDERRHFDNLILLCDECHLIVDNKENVHIYTVILLQEWKRNHESIQLTKLLANSSLLGQAINAIANADFEEVEEAIKLDSKSFEIEEKIEYNAIKRNKPLIDEYKVYHAKIAAIYKELEDAGSFKKEKLLRTIRNLYLKEKGKYTSTAKNSIDAIRANADNIIEDIQEQLAKTTEIGIPEDLTFGITVIMVDAFMRCKILEEPA